MDMFLYAKKKNNKKKIERKKKEKKKGTFHVQFGLQTRPGTKIE